MVEYNRSLNHDLSPADMKELGQKEEGSDSIQVEPNDLPISVSLHGVSKTFSFSRRKKIIAVNDISMNLYEGQITVIIGQNGAGKTTLL